jgi:hypothetical protein
MSQVGIFGSAMGGYGIVYGTNEWITPEQFGAAGDGITNDRAAIQAAINSLLGVGGGGTIFFEKPVYCYATPLNLGGARNIRFLGKNGYFPLAPTRSELRFTGVADPPIDASESYGLTLEKMGITYSNAAFAGQLIYAVGAAVDTQFLKIKECWIAGNGARGATYLMNLDKVISSEIVGNYLGSSLIGIQGMTNYSNRILVSRNLFENQGGACIRNSGEAWTISQNTFQSLYNAGAPGSPGEAGAYVHQAGVMGRGVTFEGNWFGDLADPNASSWITYTGTGLRVVGNLMGLSTGASGITLDENGVYGLEISGNSFFRVGAGGANPVCIVNGAINHGPWRIGPNHLWYNGATDLTEFGGTMPNRSIHQGQIQTGIFGLPSYANNAAALLGGLLSGDLYCETGTDPLRVAKVV